MRKRELKLLLICGSLRADSSNRRLLEALQNLLEIPWRSAYFEDMRRIPAFDPDEERIGEEPMAVGMFRHQIGWADAVAISSPEYAHGVPGSLKNVLDWIVGSGELSGKPVALLDAAPHSRFARTQLHEILRTMDAHVLDPVTLTDLKRGATIKEIIANGEAVAMMRGLLASLADAAEAAHESRKSPEESL